MITLNGIDYITEKEASKRFGFSVSWFRKLRHQHLAPKNIKILGRGKVYYSLKEITEWFKNNIKENE